MIVPPLGRKLVTESNQVDQVWYGFFRSVYDLVNSTNTTVSAGNSVLAYDQANAAFARANIANTQGNRAYDQANLAYGQANNAYGQANSAYADSNNRQYGNITGGAGGWEDLVPILQAPNDVIARAPTWNETKCGYEFNNTNDRDWYMVYQLPHGWKRGSNIRPHIHVKAFANSNGNVWIMLATSWTPSLGQQPAWSYSNTNVVFNNGTGNIIDVEQIVGLGNTVPPVGAKESSICKYVMTRYATLTEDNYAASMLLDSFDAHYYREKSGTDPEYPT